MVGDLVTAAPCLAVLFSVVGRERCPRQMVAEIVCPPPPYPPATRVSSGPRAALLLYKYSRSDTLPDVTQSEVMFYFVASVFRASFLISRRDSGLSRQLPPKGRLDFWFLLFRGLVGRSGGFRAASSLPLWGHS